MILPSLLRGDDTGRCVACVTASNQRGQSRGGPACGLLLYFDRRFLQAIAEAVVPAQWTRERQELLASDALTPASRHSVTTGESCAGSTVADVCDIAWL